MREPFAIFLIVQPATLARWMRKRNHHWTLTEPLAHARLQRTRTQKAHDRKLPDEDQRARPQHAKLGVEPVSAVGDAGRRRAKIAGAARIPSRKTAHQRRDVGDAAKFLSRLEARTQHPAVQLLARAPGKWPARLTLDRAWRLADEHELRPPLAGEGRRRLSDEALLGADRAPPAGGLVGDERGVGG